MVNITNPGFAIQKPTHQRHPMNVLSDEHNFVEPMARIAIGSAGGSPGAIARVGSMI